MWLPKDERRLLGGYYALIGDVGRSSERTYRLGRLSPLLRLRGYRTHVPKYQDWEDSTQPDTNPDRIKGAIKKEIDVRNRIRKANGLLAARGLITCIYHESEVDVATIGLTVEGYDLGRRYSNTLASSGLWFTEYREHWAWLIVAFLGGAVVTKLVDFLASLFER